MALTEHQQTLLDLLKANGGWMRRQEIARALGEEQLSAEDSMTLDRLAYEGFVVQEVSDNLGPEGETVRYRFSEPKTDA